MCVWTFIYSCATCKCAVLVLFPGASALWFRTISESLHITALHVTTKNQLMKLISPISWCSQNQCKPEIRHLPFVATLAAASSCRDGNVGPCVGPILWSWLKHLNICWRDCHDILHVPQTMNPTDFGNPQTVTQVPRWCSHLLFWGKYLDNYQMDCHEVWYRHSHPLQEEL